MNDAVSTLPPEDSAASALLALIAITGELPVSQAVRLADSAYYMEKIVTRLKKEKLINTYYHDRLRGYRLTARAKSLLLRERPEQFTRFLTGETATNKPKYTWTDRLRLHRMAEALVTMAKANVVVYPGTKPPLFEDGRLSEMIRFSSPVYYTAGEIKEIGQEAAKVRGSRATGVLLTPDDAFIVYNTGDSEMKWQYQSEMRLKTLLSREIDRARLNRKLPRSKMQAIVLASDMEQMLVLTDTRKQHKHQYFVLDGSYRHFYYVPNDYGGEFLLQLLCDRGLRASLDELLTKDLKPRDPKSFIENDGFDADGDPVLLGYLSDLPRIKRFANALALQEKAGTVICFDFQAETMRQVCGDTAAIQSIALDALKEGIVDQ